jgi:hypothetical protein
MPIVFYWNPATISRYKNRQSSMTIYRPLLTNNAQKAKMVVVVGNGKIFKSFYLPPENQKSRFKAISRYKKSPKTGQVYR